VNERKVLSTIAVAVVLLLFGCVFVEYNPWLGYVESAILYLAAVVGGGCYWIGSGRQ